MNADKPAARGEEKDRPDREPAAASVARKAMTDLIDPKREDQFWRQNWLDRRYTDRETTYEQDWGPAYRYGVDAYARHPGRAYDDIEHELSAGWTEARGTSRLDWDRARHAAREAWQRVSHALDRAARQG